MRTQKAGRTFQFWSSCCCAGLTILLVLTVYGCGRVDFEMMNTRETREYSDEGRIVEHPELDSANTDSNTDEYPEPDSGSADANFFDGEAGLTSTGDVGTVTPNDAESPDSEQETGAPDSSETDLCDGVNDEDYVETPTSCGLGVCASVGTLRCIDGVEVDSCIPDSTSGADDDCNGLDDDCDGSTDEHYVGSTTNCGVGQCARTGTVSCDDGSEVDGCIPGSATGADDDCDGLDDDCDGSTDEHYVNSTTNCGVGECARTGTASCEDGNEVISCTPGSATGADDDCDGLDDDCDGSADEHYLADASCGLGVCALGSAPSSCVDGFETACFRGTPPNGNDDEGPPGDGLDNDCDGLVDEDVPCDTGDVTVANTASGQNISIPINCSSVTVRLWGGGGGGGGPICGKSGGNGGSGGYTTVTINDLNGTEDIDISIGGGGVSGCGDVSGGTGTYQGGDGGDAAFLSTEDGENGFGSRVGGSGGSSSSGGGTGGDGKDGGGGGGSGDANLFSLGLVGNGGGGGGASVLAIGAVEIATAGGGGGGGGSVGSILTLCVGSVSGHNGGTRCAADGDNGNQAGAGGGSGACFPAGIPWSAPPFSYAMGGASCTDGNGGFAIVNFAP